MTFCGQCGLQLSPGSTRCPRCGAVVEEPGMANGELHTDDPTMASQAVLSQYQQSQHPEPSQQPQQSNPNSNTPRPPLILRSSGNDYDNSSASSQTRSVEYPPQAAQNGYAPNTVNGRPGTQNLGTPAMGTGYPGYPPPSNGNYPAQGSYPTNATPANYPTYSTPGGYPGPPMQTIEPNYASQISAPPTGYPQAPSQYQQSSFNARNRKIGMVLIVVGLFCILCAIILFALGQGLF